MTPTAPSNSTLAAVDAFTLLGDRRRRAVLRNLPADDEPTTIRSLALHVALEECEGDVPTVDGDHYRRVFVSLYHSHLPKLEDAEVIDYDAESGTVRRGPAASDVEPYLP